MEALRKHIEKISPLTDDEFERISSHFSYRRVKKGQYLVHEGDEVKQEYLVLKGICKVFFIDPEGRERVVLFAREDWWMTDHTAFFKQQTAGMFVECLEDGEVLCLTFEGREKLSTEFHKMEHFFRVKLTNAYVALQQRIVLLLSSTPQKRFDEFCKLYPDLMQRVPKKYIAEYLGVSRETLSRFYSGN